MSDNFALIDPTAKLGAACSIAAFAVIKAGVTLADRVTVDHHAVIGGLPQDLHFDSATDSGVIIGEGTVIREGVTINRATKPGGNTVVGANCFLMANSHLGHDVQLGDHVILANGVLLGGHIIVEDHCFLGGAAVFHQYIRVGEGAIISGGSRMAHDVPPFALASDYSRIRGLNLIGMKRRGFSQEEISDVKACYKAVYFQPGDPARKAKAALDSGLFKTSRGEHFLRFFESGKRGFIRSDNERG
ncbi:acyl-ACP--UDP-N-acetylglucosamine O-acyltransferase [Rubellicoccus peritrichatus]|uniref:Acyl-ACP--UDP-N-acetylglucosamine O-acyltransferase n=1 Tax=Rubellicoccus peritrichatus TaxID=3080537 RepID=A0AAQ3LC69_9BACT|nr:acyl-ACP--UDP-N-acetylglucosamine O-acyltransferase [Puniceicoccus sp. CR14]WOO42657.1 acyl-ACP--UDP-N-acetylglucosamine O-acyltransferase [Puniceicoccus sp. CR14]